jgi:hypothetical protein
MSVKISFTLREEQELQVLGNKVHRKVCGPEMKLSTEYWVRLKLVIG